jgi:hypothetical protein
MSSKHVDPVVLKAAVAAALEHVNAAFTALEPLLVVISEDERSAAVRVRKGFLAAARDLAHALVDYPKIGAAVDYDAVAIAAYLDCVALLSPLTIKVGELALRLSDSHLTWLSDAWQPSLAAYSVAKIAARRNPALRTVVSAIGKLFTAPPRAGDEETADGDEEAASRDAPE